MNKILNFTEWDSYCLVSNALKVAQKYFVFIVSITDIWANNHWKWKCSQFNATRGAFLSVQHSTYENQPSEIILRMFNPISVYILRCARNVNVLNAHRKRLSVMSTFPWFGAGWKERYYSNPIISPFRSCSGLVLDIVWNALFGILWGK